jgi:hypothetical protein
MRLPAVGLRLGRRAFAQERPRFLADDAVLEHAFLLVLALERLHGLQRLAAEVAVDLELGALQVEQLLQVLDPAVRRLVALGAASARSPCRAA